MCDSRRGGEGLASKDKLIFVLELLSQSFQSHQRAFSGPLRASFTKGGSPLHFQSDQILGFPIYVLKNLMVTSGATVHIDRRHSRDKDSLSGCYPLRQAAKRATSSLRDIPEARGPPSSRTCSSMKCVKRQLRCKFWLLATLGASGLSIQIWGLNNST